MDTIRATGNAHIPPPRTLGAMIPRDPTIDLDAELRALITAEQAPAGDPGLTDDPDY